MGKIIRNGINYGGTYDSATSVNYDNSNSGLNAHTVQEGIDEVQGNVEALNESLACGKTTLKYSSVYVLNASITFDTPMATDNISVVAIPIMTSGKIYNRQIELVSVNRNGCTLRISKSEGDFKTTDECDICWMAICK